MRVVLSDCKSFSFLSFYYPYYLYLSSITAFLAAYSGARRDDG